VVESQIVSLTPSLSFDHNLCCRCPSGSCEAILDIYTLRPFQRYKEHFNARCFDPYNRALSFWESRRTPKSHFRECEWQLHTSLKVGLQHINSQATPMGASTLQCMDMEKEEYNVKAFEITKSYTYNMNTMLATFASYVMSTNLRLCCRYVQYITIFLNC
jgi:hypothetical protein